MRRRNASTVIAAAVAVAVGCGLAAAPTTAATPALATGAPATGAPAAAHPQTAPQAPAGERCGPLGPATYAGDVPTAKQVLGFALGEREVTVAESDRYLSRVAAASDRVEAGVLARSWQGRPLRYALVGAPARVEAAQQAAQRLRDPATTVEQAAAIAERSPAILWVAGNVHGDEESGADATLRALRGLADRTDCAARTVRQGAVVAVLPVQNPDGRVAGTRRNAYGFDMNRDWFARTQPETDGKLEALADYPPALFLDVHEMGGRSYFMPPNADPIHHEITDRSIRWIDDLFGGAMARTFDRRDVDYFNQDVYDLLYMGYGDTVPTTGYLGAGMTLEKGGDSPIRVRTREQYLAIWSSLVAGGRQHERLLRGLGASTREAYRQGLRGELEPNRIYNPGNEVETEVPDITVRHWFLRTGDPSKADETQRIVRRLQRMDVEVRRLTAPLAVGDYTPYGRDARATTLPAGTYWVPMAQAQKHWVQAMLGEDSYVPFPYFYDVTAWSLPLIGNVAGGRSGERLQPQSSPVEPQPEPVAPVLPDDAPAVGVWQLSEDSTAVESSGWLRWLLTERWEVSYRELDGTDIRRGGLEGVEVLLVPDGDPGAGERSLAAPGARELRRWLADGGRLVGWAGGTELAARLALTTARLREPTSDVPGSLLRVQVDPASPLSAGVGDDAWMFYEYDPVLDVTSAESVPVRYPGRSSRDWFVSGFARGAGELSRTASVVDETYADGRVVLFASEPNFRGFTEGTQQLLWNAMLGAAPAPARTDAATGVRAQRRLAAQAAARVDELSNRVVVTVDADAAGAARDALTAAGVTADQLDVSPADSGTRFAVRLPGEAESPPLLRRAIGRVTALGDDVRAVYAPQ